MPRLRDLPIEDINQFPDLVDDVRFPSEKHKSDWKETARKDPDIAKWYSSMRNKNPRLPYDVVEYMETDQSNYDYRKAIESGNRPSPQKDHQGQYRWSDIGKGRNYIPPDESQKPLAIAGIDVVTGHPVEVTGYEILMKQEAENKRIAAMKQQLMQTAQAQETSDPERWTVEQTEKYFKENPAKDIQEDVQRAIFLRKKEETKEQAIQTAELDEMKSRVMPMWERLARGVATGAASTVEGTGGGFEWAGLKKLGKTISLWGKTAREFYQVPDPKFIDQVASGVGSLGTFLIPGIGISKGAQALSFVPKLAAWLGVGASSAFEAMTEAGSTYHAAKEKGMDEKGATAAATFDFWMNVPTIVFTNKLGIFGDQGPKIFQTLVSGGMEGAQEFTQQLFSNIALNEPDFLKGAGTAAAVGAITGAGAKGAAITTEAVQDRLAEGPIRPPDLRSERGAVDLPQDLKPTIAVEEVGKVPEAAGPPIAVPVVGQNYPREISKYREHLENQVKEAVAGGMPEGEARAAALNTPMGETLRNYEITEGRKLLDSEMAKETQESVKERSNSGGISQEPPESTLAKVPQAKRELVKKLYKATTDSEVTSIIMSDPDYQYAAAKMQEALKTTPRPTQEQLEGYLDSPETRPENWNTYNKEFNRVDIPSQEKPRAIFIFGMPGAQKSHTIKALGLDKDAVQVDADDAKKIITSDQTLANVVHEESSAMAEALLHEAIAQKKNIVMPKIGRSFDSTLKLVHRLEEAGYQVEVYLNELSQIESRKRAYNRWLAQGRLVHDDYIKGIDPLTISKVYDIISQGRTHNKFDINKKWGEVNVSILTGPQGRVTQKSSGGIGLRQEAQAIQGPRGADRRVSPGGIRQEGAEEALEGIPAERDEAAQIEEYQQEFDYTKPAEEQPPIKPQSPREIVEARLREAQAKKNLASEELMRRGFVDFRGRKIRTSRDVHDIVSLYRDPKKELYQVIFVKDGVLQSHQITTSGKPGYVAANQEDFRNKLKNQLLRLQPDEVWVAHNHPSGIAKPSNADLRFTAGVSNMVDRVLGKIKPIVKGKTGFRGHIVIDHDTYAVLNKDSRGYWGSSSKTRIMPVTKSLPDYSGESDIQLTGLFHALEVAKWFHDDPAKSTIFYLDPKNEILGIETFGKEKNIAQKITDDMRKHKALYYVVINPGKALIDDLNLSSRAKIGWEKLPILGKLPLGLQDIIAYEHGGDVLTSDDPMTEKLELRSMRNRGVLKKRVYEGLDIWSESKIDESGRKAHPPMTRVQTPGRQLPMEGKAARPITLEEYIRRRGGIDLEKSKAAGYSYESYKGFGNQRVLRKGGWGLDDLAKTLEAEGILDVPEGVLPSDALINMLRDNKGIKRVWDEPEGFSPTRKQKAEAATEEEEKKRREFINTVKESKRTRPELKKIIESQYVPITNKETLDFAKRLIEADPDEAQRLAEEFTAPSAISNAIAQEIIMRYQNEGRWEDAKRLVERTAERNTAAGQAIQALSMYNRLTPEGIVRYAHKVIKQAQRNVTQKERLTYFEKTLKNLTKDDDKAALAKRLKIPYLDDKTAQELFAHAKKIQAMPEGREKAIETAMMLKRISSLIPKPLGNKISLLQTMAMLLNPKTIVRNILGNAAYMTVENISDMVGAAIDIPISAVTGKRTHFFPDLGAQWAGLKSGWLQGLSEALHGVDLMAGTSKFDIPRNSLWDRGVLGGLEKALSVVLRAPDRAFFQAAFIQSLNHQMKNAGVTDPTPEMIENATVDGLRRTFQDDNAVSRAFVGIKKVLNAGKGFGLGDMVLKFPKTPSNLLKVGLEYTPAGFFKSMFQLYKATQGEFNQKEFVRSVSNAFVGSAGLFGIGALMAALGLITGRRSKDKDLTTARQLVGIRDYQLNISALKRFVLSGFDPDAAKMREDDTLVSYDWLLPVSLPVALGANVVIGKGRGVLDRSLGLLERLAESTDTLTEQSMMRGLKMLTGKENIIEGFASIFKDVPASFVPTLLNQIRQLTDNTSRNTKDPNFFAETYNRVKAKIPGLAGTLPAVVTPLGENKQAYQGGTNNPFNVFLNPAFVGKYKPDTVSRMVLDIWEKTGETVQFPRVAPEKIRIPGEREMTQLSPEQYESYQRYIGEKTNVLFNILANNEGFMELPDEEKAKKLQGFLTDINQAAKIEVLGIMPSRKPSKDVLSVIRDIVTDIKEVEDAPIEELPL